MGSGSLDSAVPGIGNTIIVPTERLTTASFHTGSKKKKGASHLNVCVGNFKSGKGDPKLQVSSGLNENLSVSGGELQWKGQDPAICVDQFTFSVQAERSGTLFQLLLQAGGDLSHLLGDKTLERLKGMNGRSWSGQYFLIAACG